MKKPNVRFSRQDFVCGRCTRDEYHAQFATPEIVAAVVGYLGEEELQKCAGYDMAQVPDYMWSRAVAPHIAKLRQELAMAEDSLSIPCSTLIAKEAGKLWLAGVGKREVALA